MTRPVDAIPEEELAPELDMAIDHYNNLKATADRLDMLQVELDSYADGEFTGPVTCHLRDAQSHIREAQALMESKSNIVESRIGAIEERLSEGQEL